MYQDWRSPARVEGVGARVPKIADVVHHLQAGCRSRGALLLLAQSYYRYELFPCARQVGGEVPIGVRLGAPSPTNRKSRDFRTPSLLGRRRVATRRESRPLVVENKVEYVAPGVFPGERASGAQRPVLPEGRAGRELIKGGAKRRGLDGAAALRGRVAEAAVEQKPAAPVQDVHRFLVARPYTLPQKGNIDRAYSVGMVDTAKTSLLVPPRRGYVRIEGGLRNLGAYRVLARRVGRARFADEVELRVGRVKRIRNERRHRIFKMATKRGHLLQFKGSRSGWPGSTALSHPRDRRGHM